MATALDERPPERVDRFRSYKVSEREKFDYAKSQDAFAQAEAVKRSEFAAQTVAREERMAKSASLDDEMQRWEFEKQKAFDENAKKRAIINSERAVEATNKLFAIDTKASDAESKMGALMKDYGDLLDPKTGEPRFIGQWEFNLKNLAHHRAEAARETTAQAEAMAAARARGAASVKPEATVEDAAKRLSHLESLRMKDSVDPDVKAYLDTEITRLKTPAAATPVQRIRMKLDENGNLVPVP